MSISAISTIATTFTTITITQKIATFGVAFRKNSHEALVLVSFDVGLFGRLNIRDLAYLYKNDCILISKGSIG